MRAGCGKLAHQNGIRKRGYLLQTEEELAQQKKVWNSEPRCETEEEMAAYFRKIEARVILDFAFTKKLPLEKVREYHDYAPETQRRFPDVILGNWLQIDPRTGASASTRCTLLCKTPTSLTTSSGVWPARRSTWISCRLSISIILSPATGLSGRRSTPRPAPGA